ncbi:hypothetical protein BsWGS_06003 [Bradybaena similaris]
MIVLYLEAAEMWFYRRMMDRQIPWTDKKRNYDLLREMNLRREMVTRIKRRQSALVGHVMRRRELEYVVSTGRLEGKRGRGRPRETMLEKNSKFKRRIIITASGQVHRCSDLICSNSRSVQ